MLGFDSIGRLALGQLPSQASVAPVFVDAWNKQWAEPVRVPPRLHAANNPAFFWSESAQFPETVTESRWHQPWSEPVRVKPRLITGAQKDFFWSESAQFPETVTESRW